MAKLRFDITVRVDFDKLALLMELLGNESGIEIIGDISKSGVTSVARVVGSSYRRSIPNEELFNWKPGRILSEQDIKTLNAFIEETANDLLLMADTQIGIENNLLQELGGETLMKVYRESCTREVQDIIQKCLAKFDAEKEMRRRKLS